MEQMGQYTRQQNDVGNWVRKIAAESDRGWKEFYHTREWTGKRREILARDRHECKRCREHGVYRHATTVHHMVHLREAPELALEDTNLISLCSECHEAVHPEKHERKGFVNAERW